MKIIKRLKMHNYRRFEDSNINFNDDLNIIVGDNEAGKSSILQAINLVISGSKVKVDNVGLESLFNINAIKEFMESDKRYEDLPELYVEIYLNEQNNFRLNGQINSENIVCDGLCLECKPSDDYSEEITEILQQEDTSFPFEYYTTSFKTFSGEGYTGYRRFIKKIFLDNSAINSEYATREYIKDVYSKNASPKVKAKHDNEYRKHKSHFVDTVFNSINEELDSYKFDVKTDTKSNLVNDLAIREGNISISDMGQGKQCFVKTEFALQSGNPQNDIDILLLEEPENHLSHINMHKLINKITDSHSKQMFITTHNNMISTRLDLRKIIIMNSNSETELSLGSIPEGTAKFFMKSPDNNILEYILSKKVILVEGDAEYILMDAFFKTVTRESPSEKDVHIISVGGTRFKRYLDLCLSLGIKTAVVRDNDGNYQANCFDLYSEYQSENIKVFSDSNNDNYTFEVNMYNCNSDICEELFAAGRRTLTVLQYMLDNKATVAYEILDKKEDEITVPTYIKEAIEWISN